MDRKHPFVQSSVRARLASRVGNRSDAELLAGILVGDRTAWPLVVDRHGRRLFAIARSAGLDAAAASDVVQATWLTLLDKCATIRNGDALHAWLSTVARHEAIRASVCSRRTVAEDLDDRELAAGTAGPDDQAITLAMTEAMVSAVAGLSPMRAELVHLRYFAGLSYAEIHRATGVPVGSIGPTIGRALTTLRAHVEQSPTAA